MPFSESDVLPDGKVGCEGCRRALHEKGTSRLKKKSWIEFDPLSLPHPCFFTFIKWDKYFWIRMLKRYVENYDIKLYAGFR